MMIFKFQKYINPVSYFNLKTNNGFTIFPDWNSLSDLQKSYVNYDHGYKTSIYAELDASWQLVQKGLLGDYKRLDKSNKINILDEYRFVRKYYHIFWLFYILIIRLLSFKNPFKEIFAFIKSLKIKRINVFSDPIPYPDWKDFKSTLIQTQPKVSVIIPTLNRYDYLKDVLKDLENQTYKNFDVLVIDQSEPFKNEFYKDFKLDLKVHYQKEKALWLARNSAIKISDAELFLLFDDDSRVDENWIYNHIKCLDFFNCDISSGVSISVVGAKVPETYGYFKISDQIDTGNVLIKKEVFKNIGLFDRQFEKQRMGDAEFGLRAYLAGFTNVSNPYAKRVHLKVGSGGLRDMGSWDGFRPKNWLAPRPIPSVLYLYRKYYGNTLAKFALLKSVPQSLIPYKYKRYSEIIVLGFILTLLLFPLVLYQVVKSWKKSSEKLKQGEIIEKL